ncbi:MAG: hypothetical protein RSD99_22845, partial [Janthinobacterium sp.]
MLLAEALQARDRDALPGDHGERVHRYVVHESSVPEGGACRKPVQCGRIAIVPPGKAACRSASTGNWKKRGTMA